MNNRSAEHIARINPPCRLHGLAYTKNVDASWKYPFSDAALAIPRHCLDLIETELSKTNIIQFLMH